VWAKVILANGQCGHSNVKEPASASCTVLEFIRKNYLSKVFNFNLPHLHLAPCSECPCSNFVEILDIAKLGVTGLSYLRDPSFSRFSRTPTFDGQTDGHTKTAHSALA